LAAALTLTTPVPDPESPLAIVSQDTVLDELHAQPAAVVMATDRSDAPPAPTVRVPGETLSAHPPDCVTLIVCPATVIVPVRAAPEFAGTANVTAARSSCRET